MDGDSSDAKVIDSATAEVTIKQDKADVPEIELSIEINKEPPYEGGCSLQFIAQPNIDREKLPENIRWEWYWGDGGEDVRTGKPHNNQLNSEFSHVYTVHGTFTAMVKLYDDDTGTLLSSATHDINIDNIGAINRTLWARAMVSVGWLEDIQRYHDGQWVISTGDRQTFGWIGENGRGKGLNWKGNNFSVTYGGTQGTQTTTYTISGKISADATTVETITAKEEFIDTATNWTRKQVLTLTNVPLHKGNCGKDVVFKALITGADSIRQYITHYEYESKSPEQITKFTGFDWAFQINEPKLEVEFSAME